MNRQATQLLTLCTLASKPIDAAMATRAVREDYSGDLRELAALVRVSLDDSLRDKVLQSQ